MELKEIIEIAAIFIVASVFFCVVKDDVIYGIMYGGVTAVIFRMCIVYNREHEKPAA